MSDLISRQAAILAIEEYADRLQMVNWKENPGVPYKAYALNWAINTLRELPSAQPELCEDAVSRQRLLSDLKELVAAWKKYPVMAEQIKGVEAAIGYVEAIPSAQPEQEHTMEEFMYGQDMGNPEDGSL